MSCSSYDGGTVGQILMIILTAGLWYSGTVVLQLVVHRGHPWHKSSSPPVPTKNNFLFLLSIFSSTLYYKISFNISDEFDYFI